MTSVQRHDAARSSRPVDRVREELRRVVLLLETADALDLRARRSTDPVQAAQLHQHAEERRQEAARLRSRLGALRRQSPARRPAFG